MVWDRREGSVVWTLLEGHLALVQTPEDRTSKKDWTLLEGYLALVQRPEDRTSRWDGPSISHPGPYSWEPFRIGPWMLARLIVD